MEMTRKDGGRSSEKTSQTGVTAQGVVSGSKEVSCKGDTRN